MAMPDVKQFMDATGADFNTAAQLLYGNVGANTDTRNWDAIMASADPVAAAKQATAQMYNSSDYKTPAGYDTAQAGQQLGRYGNQSAYHWVDPKNDKNISDNLFNNAGNGTLLTSMGSPDQYNYIMDMFGFGDQKQNLPILQNQIASSHPDYTSPNQMITPTSAATRGMQYLPNNPSSGYLSDFYQSTVGNAPTADQLKGFTATDYSQPDAWNGMQASMNQNARAGKSFNGTAQNPGSGYGNSLLSAISDKIAPGAGGNLGGSGTPTTSDAPKGSITSTGQTYGGVASYGSQNNSNLLGAIGDQVANNKRTAGSQGAF